MQEHRDAYKDRMTRAFAAERDGAFHEAIELALSSWDHIDGMMQYERKYEDREFDSVQAIDLILEYAPFLLDFHTLDKLAILLKDYRRIERHTSDSYAEKLAEARLIMWEAHRLWDYLEFHPDARQDELRANLGGDQGQWRSVATLWEKMGLLRRTPEGRSYRLTLCTRMGKVVPAKCPSCGAVTEAPKAMFLEDIRCPECRAVASFVFHAEETTGDLRE